MQPWQALVANADLVGVIECVTGGEVVARYRIVDSWKGPPVGTEVLVRGLTSVWEPSLPIALVGDRLLVAAWNSKINHGSVSLGSYSAGPSHDVPAWWRDEHPDFVIPSPLHFTALTPTRNGPDPQYLLGRYEKGLGRLRREAKALFALTEEQREAAVLWALIDWHILAPVPHTRVRYEPDKRELAAKARKSSVDSVLTAFLEFARKERTGTAAIDVLSMGGGLHTLARLEKEISQNGDFSHSALATSSSIIRRRLGIEREEKRQPGSTIRPPPETLDAMRNQLRLPMIYGSSDEAYRDARNRWKAFETLTVHDPKFTASYLREWYAVDDGRGGETHGFVLGSYFGWKCPVDREALFRELAQARDPYVRVAGAIYLSFEDEIAGIRALRDMSKLSGDPGIWASLNLARHGDKDAARRALEVFSTSAGPTVYDRLHLNLQKRLVVLLSNSAARSHLPQPPRWGKAEKEQIEIYADYLTWWNENHATLELWDPWLPALVQQKIE